MTASEVQPENPALRLALYLKEFVGLRTTTVRDVAKYDSVLWFGDMPLALLSNLGVQPEQLRIEALNCCATAVLCRPRLPAWPVAVVSVLDFWMIVQ